MAQRAEKIALSFAAVVASMFVVGRILARPLIHFIRAKRSS